MNFKNIINLKNKKELLKFKLTEPIYQNNYLFHYLILLNNLKGLKLYKFPIYKENSDGLNGFHLAAKEDNIKILVHLIKIYPEYIYNRNTERYLFTNYLNYDKLNELMELFPKLDWSILIDKNLLKFIILNLNFIDLDKFINKFFIIDKNNISLFEICKNNNLSLNEKIKILNKFPNINMKNEKGEGLILYAFNDIKLFNYLIKRNIDINYYTVIKTENPIRKAIVQDIINNKKEFTENININIDICNELNRYSENIIHTILFTRISRNSQLLEIIDNPIELDILKIANTETWNQFNVNKISPLELISKLDFGMYNIIFTSQKIKINSIILPKINNEKWLNLFKKLESFTKSITHINIENYIHCTKFQSRFKDIGLFTIYLNESYSNLYIPSIKSYELTNLTFIDSFPFSDDLIMKNPIFPWIINFNSENEYYIHPYLNNIINRYRRNKDKQFCMVFLSLSYENLLHANILIYDFINMTVERFEPYGNIDQNDSYIDDILEEELTWNTGLMYLRPKDYLPYTGFQTLSNENNNNNLKPGDFGGFCLAWCLWYLESKLINPNVKSKILVRKLITIINNLNINFTEYIRNYSNKINNQREIYLNKIGIDEKNVSNLYFSKNDNVKLTNYLIGIYNN